MPFNLKKWQNNKKTQNIEYQNHNTNFIKKYASIQHLEYKLKRQLNNTKANFNL
jgi:hypothetical protein